MGGRSVEYLKRTGQLTAEEEKPLPPPPSLPDAMLPPIKRRNLIMHIAPFRKNDSWLRNVAQITKRWDLFNGKKVIAIATGHELQHPDAVVRELPRDAETLTLPNSRELRENATFAHLMERIESTRGDEASFFCHSKGTVSLGNAQGVMYWRNAMYHHLLDDPDKIMDLLKRYWFVGTHRKNHPDGKGGFPSNVRSAWHYSGTYMWFRHDAVFSDPRWKNRIPPSGWGVEAWPGVVCPYEKAACVYLEGCGNPYDPASYDHANRFADDCGEPQDAGASRVELGGGTKPRDGFTNIDLIGTADIRMDLERVGLGIVSLPFADDEVDQVYSSHCLEHIRGYGGVLREIARVCRVGAHVEIRVPWWNDEMAMCQTHKHTIPPIQVDHWSLHFREDWFPKDQCTKYLRHDMTTLIPGGNFDEVKQLFPSLRDDQIMRLFPNCCHEARYFFCVCPND